MYELKGQISYNNNHCYTRCKMKDGKYYKYDGNDSIPKTTSADPKNTMAVLYEKKDIDKESDKYYLQKYIYSPKYFVESREAYRKKDRDHKSQKYHDDQNHREDKPNYQKEYEKEMYDNDQKKR